MDLNFQMMFWSRIWKFAKILKKNQFGKTPKKNNNQTYHFSNTNDGRMTDDDDDGKNIQVKRKKPKSNQTRIMYDYATKKRSKNGIWHTHTHINKELRFKKIIFNSFSAHLHHQQHYDFIKFWSLKHKNK